MDLLFGGVQKLVLVVGKAALLTNSKKVAFVIGQHIDTGLTTEELNAKVEKALGNGFAQHLLDIKAYTDVALAGLETQIQESILEQSVLAEYRDVERRIEETMRPLTPWLQNHSNFSAEREFLRIYKKNDPIGAIHWLHKRLTTATVGRTLTDDIVAKCGPDWRQFLVWQQQICLRLSQACSLELAYLKIKGNPFHRRHCTENIAAKIEQNILNVSEFSVPHR